MSQENQGSPPPAAPTPQTVTIPLEQLQAFTNIQARLAEHESACAARPRSRSGSEQPRILAERGNLQDALRQLRDHSEQQLNTERQKQAEIQQRAQQYALDSELSRVLAAENLVPGGVEQLARLFRGEFVVEPQGNAFAVRTPTYQSVPDFIKAQLGRPEYSHFLRAQNPGGGTASGQPVQAAQTPPASPRRAPAEEHGRGRHPAYAEPPESPGRCPGEHEPADGASLGAVACSRSRTPTRSHRLIRHLRFPISTPFEGKPAGARHTPRTAMRGK